MNSNCSQFGFFSFYDKIIVQILNTKPAYITLVFMDYNSFNYAPLITFTT